MSITAQIQPAGARRGIRRSARAFTILEVMVSAFVMVLVLTSSLSVLARGYQAIDSARYETLAGQILQSQMEKLRLLSWSSLTTPWTTNGGVYGSSSFTPDFANLNSAQINNFQCTQVVAYHTTGVYGTSTSPFYQTMMDITLTAHWTGTDGMKRSRIYTTQYAKGGISDFYYTP